MAARGELVGRRAELEELGAFLARLRGGLEALVLTGPAGMGKTSVWREGLRLGRKRGYQVLSARPSGAEARLSFTALSDLLAPVGPEHLERLPPTQRDALDVALLRSDAGAGGVDPRAIATGVLSLLRVLAADGPVLVAIDDTQWLDAATAAALAFALRRLEDEPVGVLATVRIDDGRPETLLDAVPSERRADVTLRPLSVAAVHEILRARVGLALPRRTIVKIVDASGGNPFYAIEIARELGRLGRVAVTEVLPVPGELRTLLRARLDRLPATTRDALFTAACLSVPRVELVDGDALAPAEEAGLVLFEDDGRIRFAHPLLAAAVYESQPTARRRAVHRKLAAAVQDPEERARHVALGSTPPSREAARRLDEAAVLAHARGAPHAAAELVELALRLAPRTADDEHAERLLAAAGFHFEAGDLARAHELADEALTSAGGEAVRAQTLRLVGQLHSRRNSFHEAIAAALDALEAAGGDAALRAGIELDIAYYRTSLGDFWSAGPHARAAVEHAEALGLDASGAEALAVHTMVEFLCGRGLAEADLDHALALEDPRRSTTVILRPRFIQGLLLLWTGRLDESLDTLDSLRGEALERGRESDALLVALYLVWACVWRGDLERAVQVADEAQQAARALDDRALSALALSTEALVRAHTGDAERTRAAAEDATALFEQLGWRSGTIWPSWALGVVGLSLGDPAATHAALGPLAGFLTEMSSADPALGVFLPDEIEALCELGEQDRAQELLGWFERRARAVERGWALAAAARCRGLLLAAGGDLDGALAALEEARRSHAELEMPLEHARTLFALGRLQRRRKQKRLARLALEEAVSLFESLGSPLWAARCRAELARVTTRKAAQRTDGDGGANRAARGRGPDESGDRRAYVRDREDGRGQPRPRLPQARDQLAGPARARAREAPADSVGFPRLSPTPQGP